MATISIILRQYFLEKIHPRNRFANNQDIQNIMDYLEQFISAVPAYSLELSRNLNDLDRLVEFIQNDEK